MVEGEEKQGWFDALLRFQEFGAKLTGTQSEIYDFGQVWWKMEGIGGIWDILPLHFPCRNFFYRFYFYWNLLPHHLNCSF